MDSNGEKEKSQDVGMESSHPQESDTGKKDDVAAVRHPPGQAWIKSEYILPDHQRVLSVQYLAKNELKQLGTADDSAVSTPTQGDGGTEAALEQQQQEQQEQEQQEQQQGVKRDSENAETPPGKRIKLKGKNRARNRHQTQRPNDKEKICSSILQEKTCEFHQKGNCKFSHDVADYMSKKLPDLGDRCYMFETFGYCPAGISCRFGSRHISPEFKNIVNEELYEKTKATKTVVNILDKQTLKKLWKRTYDFSKANSITKQIREDFQKKIIAEGGHGRHRRGDSQDSRDESLLKSSDGDNSEPKLDSESAKVDGQVETARSDKPSGAQPTESKNLGSSDSAAGDGSRGEGDASTAALTLPAANGAMDGHGDAGATAVTDSSGADAAAAASKKLGCLTDEDMFAIRPGEKKTIDFRDKLYLAPLTTVGNLPFRRVCKQLGADITCSEMARSSALLQGNANEWALMKRHVSEDIFGIQVCGGQPDTMARCAQLLNATVSMDFLDINCGCPIDYIFNHGEGCALMGRGGKFEQVCRSMRAVLDVPLTAKMRTGIYANKNVAHSLLPRLRDAGVSLVTLHGRSREQRYTRLADWDYIQECSKVASPMPLFGNGDILSYEDYELQRQQTSVSGIMIGRGALIKPWIFQEIKERRHWDISAEERLDILRDFVHFGLEHWGSDQHGVDHTRRFLLEWLSFFHRYIPVGILERLPQRINERPPYYRGRSDLETLLASANCADWVKISEMLLGPVPDGFVFLPKHKANAYQ